MRICTKLNNRYSALIIILLTVGVSSAFINNTPVVILFIPVVKAFADKYPGLEVLELIRYSHIYHPLRDRVESSPDDLILVK